MIDMIDIKDEMMKYIYDICFLILSIIGKKGRSMYIYYENLCIYIYIYSTNRQTCKTI